MRQLIVSNGRMDSAAATSPGKRWRRSGRRASYLHRHCEERSDEAIHLSAYKARWIASRSPSSGAHSRDPLARNDGLDLSTTRQTTRRANHFHIFHLQTVDPFPKKYSASVVGQITGLTLPVSPDEGRLAIVTNV